MKINADNLANKAKMLYSSGLCCSESITMAFAEEVNADNPNVLMKMSSGLCGGLGYGELCGALSASACGLGLYFGRESVHEVPPVKCSALSRELAEAFKAEFGSVRCEELTAGMQKGTPEQREKCKNIIGESIKITTGIINR